MKKLLSILTLLLCVCSGAWAQTTLFLWQYDGSTTYGDGSNNGEFAMTAATGTAKFVTYEKKTAAKEDFGANHSYGDTTDDDLKPSISAGLKLGNNGAHIKCSPASGNFQAGDIIYVCAYKPILITTGADSPASTSDVRNNGVLTGESGLATGADKFNYAVGSITLPANFVATDRIYISRFSDSSPIAAIKIVRPAPPTDPVINASAATINATVSGVEATQDIAITGANLTGSTLTATLSPAVAGLSVTLASNTITDGAISTTATLHYTQTENASGSTTLTLSDGTTSKNVTVTYRAKVTAATLKTISEAKVWDFSTKVSGEKQYTDEDQKVERVYTDIDGLTFTSPFDEEALAFKGEYPFRDNKHKYAQNGTLHFRTSVPGTIIVKFSDTGTTASATAVKRYLVVNGVTTEYWASRQNNGSDNPYAAQLNITTEAIPVPAGDVTITGTSALIMSYISFTPLNATTDVDVVKVTDVNYATYVTTAAIDFTKTAEVQAYKVTSTTDAIEYEEVEAAPAGTPLLIKATSSSYVLKAADSTPADVTGNLLQASIGSTVGDGSTIYVLGNNGGTAVWGKLKNGKTLSAGKAYLVITGGGAKEFYDIIIGGDGETTAIDHISTPLFNSNAAIYNLSGQKVTESYKGIVIVNGKKYMNK